MLFHNAFIRKLTGEYHLTFQFHTGEPCKLRNDPDYVPSIFTFSSAASNREKVSRYKRLMQRRERQYHLQTSKEKRHKPLKSRNDKQSTVIQSQSEGNQEGQDTVQMNTGEEFIQHEDECNVLHDNPQVQSSKATIESCGDNSSELADQPVETTSTEQTFVVKKKDEGINTDFNWESWHTMEETIKFQQEIIASLSADLREALSHAKRLENDDFMVLKIEKSLCLNLKPQLLT